MFKVRSTSLFVIGFIYAGIISRPVAAGEIIDNAIIDIKANIVSDSCQTLDDSPLNLSINLGDISLSYIKGVLASQGQKQYASGQRISFKCSSGIEAKFKVIANSPLCLSSQSHKMLCGGGNKSIGMAATLVWPKDVDGGESYLFVHNEEQPLRTMALNKEGLGFIKVGHVELRQVDGEEMVPGEISGQYTLQIWSD